MEWLNLHVHGLGDRREARKYASQLLKQGLIKHTVSKGSFNENCYFTFGDMITFVSAVNGLRLEDDQCSERDTNLLLGQQGSPWHHPQLASGLGLNGSSKIPFWGPGGGETVNYGVFGAQPAASDPRITRPSSDTSSSETDQRSQLSGPFPKSYQPMTTFAHNDSSNRGANGSEEIHSNGHNHHPELPSGNTGHYHYLNPGHFSVESPVV